MQGETLVSVFNRQVERLGDQVALKRRNGELWESISWRDYGRHVQDFGLGLASMGFEPGQVVSIFSNNCPEWHMADVACLSMGGITVPIYQTSAEDQIEYILGHAETRFIVVQNQEFLAKILRLRDALPNLEGAILIEGESTDDFVKTLADVESAGREYSKNNPGAYEERSSAVTPEQTATLVYTSGTTGRPKGAEITHHNIVWTCDAVLQVIEADNRDRILSYLPLSHILERLSSHFNQIHLGCQTWFAESVDTLVRDLGDCHPTIFVAVPRVWEKAYGRISEGIEESTGIQHTLATKAVALGIKKVELEQAGKSLGTLDSIVLGVLGKVVFSKIKGQLGLDSARICISGAAPLASEIMTFFAALGLPICEGYGQTEDTGPTSLNPPGKIKIGTVGPPLPGVSVKIADDGEILVRGENVFRGYFKNQEATDETLKDGWLYSGDVGVLDEDGYITITDRKKDLIITAGGKNIAPQELEGRIKFSPIVSQAVVIGDRRKYLTALVTLDPDGLEKWATDHGKKMDSDELVADADVISEVQKAIDDTNSQFSRTEGIKKFEILPRDFTIEDGEMTPSLKVRRRIVVEKYSDIIEGMYAE